MIKAGSLLYAVYVCLLISLLTGALIFVFSLNLNISAKQNVQSELIDLCDSCLDYYLANSQNFMDYKSDKLNLFDNGQICEFGKSSWGFYTGLFVKAYFKNDTIQKNSLVGKKQGKEKLALYLSDWQKVFKVSGSTFIKGDMNLPSAGFKIVNILGNNQLNKPVVSGEIYRSNQLLPEILVPNLSELYSNGRKFTLNEFSRKSTIFNGFMNKTLVINLGKGEQLDNITLKGNIFISSADTLYINNSTRLEEVIIKAPKIVIEEGFVGRAQFFADSEIFVNKNVILNYPSSIAILSNSNIFNKKITVLKGSSVFGGVIVESSTFDEKEGSQIIINEGAFIMGSLFCNGKLQLKGEVLGTVHAHKLILETKSGVYDDILLNAKIDAVGLPKGFINLPLFKKLDDQIYGIVKTL